MIADKSWFKIKRQDMYLDEFYNANNRTWQYYLNITKMYQYSLFANAVVLATQEPTITITSLGFNSNVVSLAEGDTASVAVDVKPFGATTPEIVFTSSDDSVFTVSSDADNGRIAKVVGVGEGTGVLTATAGNVSSTVTISVTSA